MLRVIEESSVTDSAADYTVAYCPEGMIASGGGYLAPDPGVVVQENRPTDDGTGWLLYSQNNSGNDQTMRVYAMCVEGVASSTGPTPPPTP